MHTQTRPVGSQSDPSASLPGIDGEGVEVLRVVQENTGIRRVPERCWGRVGRAEITVGVRARACGEGSGSASRGICARTSVVELEGGRVDHLMTNSQHVLT